MSDYGFEAEAWVRTVSRESGVTRVWIDRNDLTITVKLSKDARLYVGQRVKVRVEAYPLEEDTKKMEVGSDAKKG